MGNGRISPLGEFVLGKNPWRAKPGESQSRPSNLFQRHCWIAVV
jgi:hypothetical protein